MFPSSNNINPFPHFPSSFHLSPSYIGQNHHDLLLGHLPTNGPSMDGTFSSLEVTNKVTTLNQAINGLIGGDHYDPLSLMPKKKPVKKDRHSKIFTAQGQRDRRVRLSIGIARRFFDLQDMLGFDKASKTLDWLLTQSKTAINELVLQMKQHNPNGGGGGGGGGGFSSTSECEVVSRLMSNEQAHRASIQLLARESRAKARARARERTREKMSIRKLNESKRLLDLVPPMLIQSSSLNQTQTCKKLGSQTHITNSPLRVDSAGNEPISQPQFNNSARRKYLKPSSIFEYHQDLPKQVNAYIPQHSGSRSSFCPMASMNASLGFQIYGKHWESYNNSGQC